MQAQVSIYSREEIETLLQKGFPDRAAVISFYYKDTEPVDLSGIPNEVFQVAVEDVDLYDLEQLGLTYMTFFPEAEELVKFILTARNAGMEIICQCEYGQGPSAGCAAAIRQFYNGDGIEVFTNGRYFPNLLMYHKVYSSLDSEWQFCLAYGIDPPKPKRRARGGILSMFRRRRHRDACEI